MNPYVSQELVRLRLDELRREAAAARLARSIQAPAAELPSEPRRVRAAIGSRLVRLGLRLGGEAAME